MQAAGYRENVGLQGVCALSRVICAGRGQLPCCEDTQESRWGQGFAGRNLLVPTASSVNMGSEGAILEVDPPPPVRPSDGTSPSYLAHALTATSRKSLNQNH